MKFKVADDIDAPIDRVWVGLTDFAPVEVDARDRGADLARVGDWREPHVGAAWRGSVPVRGKTREIAAEVTTLSPETKLVIDSQIGGMAVHYRVEIISLSAQVTRVAVELELKASSLSARLLLQTMKIGRRRVLQRMERALARRGNAVERAWRAAAASSG